MDHMRHRISVEALENGFEVEVPDMVAMKKKMMESKKKGDSMPYMGDMTKKYAAKSVKEVIRFVTGALNELPENDYDKAFNEAAGK